MPGLTTAQVVKLQVGSSFYYFHAGELQFADVLGTTQYRQARQEFEDGSFRVINLSENRWRIFTAVVRNMPANNRTVNGIVLRGATDLKNILTGTSTGQANFAEQTIQYWPENSVKSLAAIAQLRFWDDVVPLRATRRLANNEFLFSSTGALTFREEV